MNHCGADADNQVERRRQGRRFIIVSNCLSEVLDPDSMKVLKIGALLDGIGILQVNEPAARNLK